MKLPRLLIPLILSIMLLPDVAHTQGLQRQRQLKNVEEARGLAINNTILPVLTGVGAAYLFKNKTVRKIGASLAIYGLVMGPSAGNFYAEDYLRGGLGVAVRAGAGYMLLDATQELMGANIAEPLGWDDTSVSLTDTKILIGAGVFLGSVVYNVLSSKASVNQHNRKLGYVLSVSSEHIDGEVVPLLTARVRF